MNDDLRASYAGAFDGRLAPGRKSALLIVDVVMAYLDPASTLYAASAQEALESNVRLVAAARSHDVPVLFTNVEYQAGGLNGGRFYSKVPALCTFLKGSPWGAFPESLQPGPSDVVVTKQYASAFFGTSLAATLHSMGVDTLFITGYSTSGCVRASALDALQHGFIPFVVSDACADRHPGPHEANLFDLKAKYAEVVTETKASAMLDGSDP